MIFHLGFIPQLTTLHPNVVLDVYPRLRTISRRSFPSLTLVDCDGLPSICSDYYEVPIASLGMHLGASLEMARKRPKQYLFADAERVQHFRNKLEQDCKEYFIGISWLSISKGYSTHKTVPLDEFKNLTESLPVNLVNIQYGDITDKIQAFNEQSQRPIIDLDIDKLGDLDSLLALIDACDLVITISNVTAHLACSLGKECWILLPWGLAKSLVLALKWGINALVSVSPDIQARKR